jgi:multiubiquitin
MNTPENGGSEPESLGTAEDKLREAEAEVHHVVEDLKRDEARLENAEAKRHTAEDEVRHDQELARESKIKVNGRTRVVEGREVSFEEVVKLAFPSGPTKPNTKFTVTFRNAAQVPASGELDPGQRVRVKLGDTPVNETIFNVTETVLS